MVRFARKIVLDAAAQGVPSSLFYGKRIHVQSDATYAMQVAIVEEGQSSGYVLA